MKSFSFVRSGYLPIADSVLRASGSHGYVRSGYAYSDTGAYVFRLANDNNTGSNGGLFYYGIPLRCLSTVLDI